MKNRRANNGNRSRLDIIANILEASVGKIKKTQLMYRCNLSFKQAELYLSFLLERKLLCQVDGDAGAFRITEKGKRFLEAYKGLLGLIS
ncbi:MAG: winged helix-turn-helix domain-containing protein [Candidatus Bathyarchaeia archaeon]